MRISDWSSDVCSSDLREVHHRQQDDAAADLRRLQAAGEIEDRDRPLVLVAVIAAGEEGSGAVAVPDHGDGNEDRAPGRVVARPRQLQVAVLHAVLVEVEAGGDGIDSHGRRAEEHTSELQSLMRIPYAVFCLKKKN